jgi:hypothetical protein
MRALGTRDVGFGPALVGLRGQYAWILLEGNLHSFVHILGERCRLQAKQ